MRLPRLVLSLVLVLASAAQPACADDAVDKVRKKKTSRDRKIDRLLRIQDQARFGQALLRLPLDRFGNCRGRAPR